MKFITEVLEKHFSEKQCQWMWFVILWFIGLMSVVVLSGIIKLFMEI